MKKEVLFVSEERLKNYSGLDENIRVQDITPYILIAQDIYLQPLLGSSFYMDLKSRLVAEDELLEEEIELIEDYISKMLIQYSVYMILPHIKYKIVQKGILNGFSEDSTSTTLEELKYLRQSTLDTAEFFAARLVKHLKDYPNRFPKYQNAGSKGMKPDRSTPYFSGLVMGGKSDCNFIKGSSSYSKNFEQ